MHPLDATPSPWPVQPWKVLVADSHQDSRESMCQLLQWYGFDVTGATDGVDGLEQARRCRPDVVILDLNMPGMDGFELADAIRADARFKNTYMVALTGYGTPAHHARTTQLGFAAHLVKPVEAFILLGVLNRLRERRGHDRPGIGRGDDLPGALLLV